MDPQKPKPSELPPKKTINLDPAKATGAQPAASPPAPTQNPTTESSALQQHQVAEGKTGEPRDGTGAGGGPGKAIKSPATAAAAAALSSVPEAASGDAENDLQKKLRRAERFGVPVLLSEEEKRHSRAERFGTGSGVNEKKNVGEDEKQKRKARAERFGIKEQALEDEEAKKKARIERFGSNTKLDSLEEEKKKARAIRFSQSSITSSQGGDEIKSDLKAATVANS